ncbi:TPA: hypothetical protein N0F65_002348 [Lagenidium giganteum]|uniref:Uncharacterized protein n=1 Tax=Lagenidium giganteum TaxID=4803 RepID=A0AAV2Z1J8_9STRA|nr:TPA: hypothetical protein N0F65_002348 [Lagenidium giganteum]
MWLADDPLQVGFLENAGAQVKKKSPSSATLIKESLKPNLTAAEATTQLKVLCRKFAALTDKVKEETRVREEAEREVRRLNAVIEGNASPVVASCRTDAQLYVRELKEGHEKLKQELRFEKEKNAMLVSKALELEREKNALLQQQTAGDNLRSAYEWRYALLTDTTLDADVETGGANRQAKWDREQHQKIQETLRTTLEELQEEVTRKEEEIESYKERFNRERQRIKELERDIAERDERERSANEMIRQLKQDLEEAQATIATEQQRVEEAQNEVRDNQEYRAALEEQIETLNEVNVALEQRSNALVRRLERSACVIQECQDLKLQLRDAEVDNETLVRTIRDLKDQHFLKEKDLKMQTEQVREQKAALEQRLRELEEDMEAMRAQNAMLSEWMLVRNDNAQAKKELDSTDRLWTSPRHAVRDDAGNSPQNRHLEDPLQEVDRERVRDVASVRPLSATFSPVRTQNDVTRKLFVDTSPTTDYWSPIPEKTSDVIHASPVKQRARSVAPHAMTATNNAPARRPQANTQAKSGSSGLGASGNLDHERLRLLVSRNRELQQRLQRETDATQQLEQEISSMASAYAGPHGH